MEVKGRAKNLIFGDHWGKLKSNYQAENQGKKETFHFILRPARRCSLSPSYERGQEEERSLSKTQRSKTWSKRRISLQCYRLRFRIFFLLFSGKRNILRETLPNVLSAVKKIISNLILAWVFPSFREYLTISVNCQSMQ